MRKSNVLLSLRDDNSLDCSYAIVSKAQGSVIIILRDTECAIYDTADLKQNADCRYLLLKHYCTASQAYRDFLKLVGKMCAKGEDSKYFGTHLDEDNRIIVDPDNRETMQLPPEREALDLRLASFREYIAMHQRFFFKH